MSVIQIGPKKPSVQLVYNNTDAVDNIVPPPILWLRADQGITCGTWSLPQVTWQNAIGVSISGNSLTKTGSIGWNDAGANTVSSLSGNGSVSFSTSETTAYQMFGLSTSSNNGGDYSTINFAVYMSAGTLTIYESGVSITNIGSYSANDTFAINVSGTTVTYYHNGSLVYTSLASATFPMYGASAMYSVGATLNNVAFGTSQWNDISGNGNNVVQATAALQPAYNATDAAYNNQPTLSFSAVANTVISGGSITHAQPYTIIFVGEADLSGGSIVESGTSYSGLYTFGPGAGYICFYAGTGQQSNTGITSKSVVAAVFNGASSSIYVKNSQTAILTGNPGTGGLSGVINLGNSGLSGPLLGRIAEVIIYPTVLSPIQLKAVFGYLGARYGITTS